MNCSAKKNPATERMIYAIDHVQLAMPARQEDVARRFYVNVLGFTEQPKPPIQAARGGAWFVQGQVQLHLGVEADFRPARKAHPGLLVKDLAALLERLRTHGVEFALDDTMAGYERAFINDPFGNRIELLQRSGA